MYFQSLRFCVLYMCMKFTNFTELFSPSSKWTVNHMIELDSPWTVLQQLDFLVKTYLIIKWYRSQVEMYLTLLSWCLHVQVHRKLHDLGGISWSLTSLIKIGWICCILWSNDLACNFKYAFNRFFFTAFHQLLTGII